MTCDCKDCTCEETVSNDVTYAVEDLFDAFTAMLEDCITANAFSDAEREQVIELLIGKIENYETE